MLNLNSLKKYCSAKHGSQEDYPFGPDVIVYKTASKMFALISCSNSIINLSLKCDPLLAYSLRQEYKAIIPGYHLNKKHWNTIIIDNSIPDDKLFWLIDHSYELVFKSLSKKQQTELTK